MLDNVDGVTAAASRVVKMRRVRMANSRVSLVVFRVVVRTIVPETIRKFDF